jgi:hypothetical protein
MLVFAALLVAAAALIKQSVSPWRTAGTATGRRTG